MRVKSNTPLSDAELQKVRDAFVYDENPDAALYNLFPFTSHRIDGGTIFIGNPPWDITQEITI